MSFLVALPVYVFKNKHIYRCFKRTSSSVGNIVIGDISKDLKDAKCEHFVPRKYGKFKSLKI